MLTRDNDIRIVSVRPSVRLSHAAIVSKHVLVVSSITQSLNLLKVKGAKATWGPTYCSDKSTIKTSASARLKPSSGGVGS